MQWGMRNWLLLIRSTGVKSGVWCRFSLLDRYRMLWAWYQNQGCYAMALIRLMIQESSYWDWSFLVKPSLRPPISCVIQVVGRHRRLSKNVFKQKLPTLMPSLITLDKNHFHVCNLVKQCSDSGHLNSFIFKPSSHQWYHAPLPGLWRPTWWWCYQFLQTSCFDFDGRKLQNRSEFD